LFTSLSPAECGDTANTKRLTVLARDGAFASSICYSETQNNVLDDERMILEWRVDDV
jgi:hypothetical protein